jgi:hypothetical protein
MATYLRYNSSLRHKMGTCEDCPEGSGEKPLIKNKCQQHYNISLKIKSRDKQLGRDQKKNEEKEQWFLERRIKMQGFCVICGGRTEKENDATFKRSLAHLFAKAYFESVATHPENCLELCFFGKSCHTNLDNGTLTFETIKRDYPQAWKLIVKKAVCLYPLMTNAEQGRIPQILLDEIFLE